MCVALDTNEDFEINDKSRTAPHTQRCFSSRLWFHWLEWVEGRGRSLTHAAVRSEKTRGVSSIIRNITRAMIKRKRNPSRCCSEGVDAAAMQEAARSHAGYSRAVTHTAALLRGIISTGAG